MVLPSDPYAPFSGPAPDAPPGCGPWRPGIISNPLSGGNKGSGIHAVRACLQGYPQIPHREVRTMADLRATVNDFAARGVNLVVVNSGDGTVQALLTLLFNRTPFPTAPLLALVSGGTTNMTHLDLGLPGDHVRALRRLLNWACHGEGDARVRRRAVLRVIRSDDREPVYGFFFGAASIFRAIQFFHSSVHRMGLSGDAAHVVVLSRFLWGVMRRQDALVGPVSAAIRTERMVLPRRDYLMLLITTLDRLVLGLTPFWAPPGGPLRMTAVGTHPHRLAWAFPNLIRGRALPYARPEYGYLSCTATDVRLEMSDGYAVDGELFAVDSRRGMVQVQHGGTVDFLRL